MQCERMRILLSDGRLLGITEVDGCLMQAEVTFFMVCTSLDDNDKYATCIVSLGTFRTFTCRVEFDSVQAEVAALLLE